jgi:hypothetical protein
MKTHRTRIREHLRSARVSALTEDERREELRMAEARAAAPHGGEDEPGPAPGTSSAERGAHRPATEVSSH